MRKTQIKKLTKAEAGRLGGLAGGKLGGSIGGRSTSEPKQAASRTNGRLSKTGGRPRKYATASERQKAYLERRKIKLTTSSDLA